MEDDEQTSWTNKSLERATKLMKEKHIFLKHRDMGPFHCYGNYFVDFGDYYFGPNYKQGFN